MILNELFDDIALISGQWFGPCCNRLIRLLVACDRLILNGCCETLCWRRKGPAAMAAGPFWSLFLSEVYTLRKAEKL